MKFVDKFHRQDGKTANEAIILEGLKEYRSRTCPLSSRRSRQCLERLVEFRATKLRQHVLYSREMAVPRASTTFGTDVPTIHVPGLYITNHTTLAIKDTFRSECLYRMRYSEQCSHVPLTIGLGSAQKNGFCLLGIDVGHVVVADYLLESNSV